MDIINYLQLDKNLASSGQPSAEQFAIIAHSGYQSVINLAMPDSDNALVNEGSLVTQQGMSYLHIPVLWEAPRIDQFQLFAAMMQTQAHQRVWVHCALNMRVSCFLYLYRTRYQSVSREQAREKLHQIWTPNSVWAKFIKEVEAQ